MLKRRLHRQRRLNTCVIASLRTVLDLQYGVKVAEEALEILGTSPHDPIKKFGTDTLQLRKIVKGTSAAVNAAKPWRLSVVLRSTVEQLAIELGTGHFPMVWGVEEDSTIDHHVVVVLAIEADRLKIWDPADVQPKWVPTKKFDRWWGAADTSRLYTVVRGKYRSSQEVAND